MGVDLCTDGRFEIIARAKKAILESTNIDTSQDEMKVLDNFLFRCWQMGWLNKYEDENNMKTYEEEIICLTNEVNRLNRAIEIASVYLEETDDGRLYGLDQET